MAAATKCDRCGKFTTERGWEVQGVLFFDKDRGIHKAKVDVCPPCVMALKAWWEAGKARKGK
jgi:hypothetical protein